MIILNFNDSPRKAFVKGLLKGIGAPFMLYGSFATATAIPKVEAVKAPVRASEAVDDWSMVGQDLKTVYLRHEASTNAAS